MLLSLYRAGLGTGFLFLMTALGAAVVLFFPGKPRARLQNLTMGFAAGVMTAAAVWSLLLPAIEQAAEIGLPEWIPAGVGILSGVLLLSGLDALIVRISPQTARDDPGKRKNLLLFTAITLHNIPEGMSVGLAFALAAAQQTPTAAIILALGIGIQNFPEGAAISLPLRQAGVSRLRSFAFGALSGTVEPVFGLLAVCAAGSRLLMPWLLSFAAGAMLYVVVEELVPQAHGRAGTFGYTAGFLLMMILDVALG